MTIATCCIHHWLIDADDKVCRCNGEEHYHAVCWLCAARCTFPRPEWSRWEGQDGNAADYAKRGGSATRKLKLAMRRIIGEEE